MNTEYRLSDLKFNFEEVLIEKDVVSFMLYITLPNHDPKKTFGYDWVIGMEAKIDDVKNKHLLDGRKEVFLDDFFAKNPAKYEKFIGIAYQALKSLKGEQKQVDNNYDSNSFGFATYINFFHQYILCEIGRHFNNEQN
jgi:azurin